MEPLKQAHKLRLYDEFHEIFDICNTLKIGKSLLCYIVKENSKHDIVNEREPMKAFLTPLNHSKLLLEISQFLYSNIPFDLEKAYEKK